MRSIGHDRKSILRMTSACVLLAAALIGCGSNQVRNLSGNKGVALDIKQPVYIAVPIDPADSDYAGTGQYVATVISQEMSKRGVRISIGSEHATDEANLAAAQKEKAGYLLIPVITNWEHNATQWSFNPSSMAVRITILNVADGTQLRVDNLEHRSSHISFFGTDPKELLQDSVEDYVNDLYPGTDD